MKELPILFSAPMVLAILAGRKTVTRRIVNPRLYIEVDPVEGPIVGQGDPRFGELATDLAKSPYGRAGDRLWVREAWNVRGLAWGMRPREAAKIASKEAWKYAATDDGSWQHGWRPSIHMPRAAARIALEITDVRVERLHEITEDDAAAEGVERSAAGSFVTEGAEFELARTAFAFLWDGINGARRDWESNPWVWRVAFRRSS